MTDTNKYLVSSRDGILPYRFPSIYQIDFNVVASGKYIAMSKRRIQWRFGFTNKEALDAGETGTACRGEEHEVIIMWSVASGKRIILTDGQEVYNLVVRGSTLDYSWTLKGNHVIKVMAKATPSMSATPDARQYELWVDGQSFFTMPKVYELGINGPLQVDDRFPGVISPTGTSDAHPTSGGLYYDTSKREYYEVAPKNKKEEEEDLKQAVNASLEESRAHLCKEKQKHINKDGHKEPTAFEPTPISVPLQKENLLPDFFSDANSVSAQGKNILPDFFSSPNPVTAVNVSTPWDQGFASPTQINVEQDTHQLNPWSSKKQPVVLNLGHQYRPVPVLNHIEKVGHLQENLWNPHNQSVTLRSDSQYETATTPSVMNNSGMAADSYNDDYEPSLLVPSSFNDIPRNK